MIKTCIVGASGYTGAELAKLIAQHPEFELCHLHVSENSADAHRPLSDLYGQMAGVVDYPLLPLAESQLPELAREMDVIFLALPHEVSHNWASILCQHNAVVLDLSGAFRIKDKQRFAQFYGFEHQLHGLLEQAVYGLADWHQQQIAEADLIAVPGCYPTAALTALKPLQQAGLLDPLVRPVINATSGVSGAGRKASLTTSLNEVSLQAYGVLQHRHTPEIEAWLGTEVIFTPHLGNFKRGILATITVKTATGTTAENIEQAYTQAYQDTPIVRLRNSWPKLDDVVNTPFCDLHWKLDADSGYLVVTSAIDNLLKGAASQAVQCANLRFALPVTTGLLGGTSQ